MIGARLRRVCAGFHARFALVFKGFRAPFNLNFFNFFRRFDETTIVRLSYIL